MRQFRMWGARVAVAVFAVAGIGSQIVGERPASAQQPAFVIVPSSNPFLIHGDEKVVLSNLFTFTPNVPAVPTINSFLVQGTQGVRVNGTEVSLCPSPIRCEISATADRAVIVTIEATYTSPVGVPIATRSVGVVAIKFIPPATKPTTTTTAATTTTTTTTPATTTTTRATTTTTPATTAPATTAPAATAPATTATTAGVSPAANRPPVASPKSVIVRKNTKTAIVLSGKDPEGSPLTYSLEALPEEGKISGTAPNLQYTPDAGFLGVDALTFTVSDGKESSSPATITITVSGAATKTTVAVKKTVTTKKKTVKRSNTSKSH